MGSIHPSYQDTREEVGHALRVVDDFDDACPVTAAELDAVQAFLMPLVEAIMAGAPIRVLDRALPHTEDGPMTHNRRKAAN